MILHFKEKKLLFGIISPWFKVQVRLYKNGVTVSEVVFNGTDSNMSSWFSPSRIMTSTWSDVTPSQTYNFFNMEGHIQT